MAEVSVRRQWVIPQPPQTLSPGVRLSRPEPWRETVDPGLGRISIQRQQGEYNGLKGVWWTWIAGAVPLLGVQIRNTELDSLTWFLDKVIPW
jgi:hypothetical protein